MKLPTVTEKTIKEHINAVKKAKKAKKFKIVSNNVFKKIIKENLELAEVIGIALESKKPEEWKKGYLAGSVTIYDILRRQAKKL